MPRPVVSLKRVVGSLAEGKHLTPDLVLSLQDWRIGLDTNRFGVNARTKEEGVLRTRSILGKLEGADEFAREWVVGDKQKLDVGSQLGLRARLSDEMALCMRQGGAVLPDGSIRSDVPMLVEEVLYQTDPELKHRVEAEKTLRENGMNLSTMDGKGMRL